MMQQNCGENNHCMRRFITSMREICEICGPRDILARIKFWSFSTKERDCSRPQRMNEMTIIKQTLDVKDRHFRVRWMEFINSLWPCELLDRLKDLQTSWCFFLIMLFISIFPRIFLRRLKTSHAYEVT
jgi:hypothetical protein